MAKIQVQGIGMYDDKTLKKKIIDMANNLSKLAKKGEWSKSSENGIRALGRMWQAYQDWSRQNESIKEGMFDYRNQGDIYGAGFNDSRGNNTSMFKDKKTGRYYIYVKTKNQKGYFDMPKNIKSRSQADDFHMKVQDMIKAGKKLKLMKEGPDYDLAMKLNKIQTQIFKLGHQYKSKANVPAMMNSFMIGLTNQLKKSKLTEAIKKWKDIPEKGTLDFGKYGKYVINAKNKMFVLGTFISGSNKGKRVKWYSRDGQKDARRRKGMSISDTPRFPFGMVKESVDENMYDMSVFNLAVSHMGKFEKDFKRLIKSANVKDKKKALELMKVYKKHWIEFSVKVKDILKYD